MKFTRNTTKEIRKWLKENGFTCGCRLGKEFAYMPDDNYIEVQRKYDDSFDYDFIKCLKKLGLKNDFDCITLSILHELGHYMTVEDFTDEEWECDNIYKLFLSSQYKDQSKLNKAYWATDTEKFANLWVVDYVDTNPQAVQDLEDIIGYAIVFNK